MKLIIQALILSIIPLLVQYKSHYLYNVGFGGAVTYIVWMQFILALLLVFDDVKSGRSWFVLAYSLAAYSVWHYTTYYAEQPIIGLIAVSSGVLMGAVVGEKE